MNVLITGGAGYVGSILGETLINDGHKVVVLDNLSSGHKEAVLEPIEFIYGDISNRKLLTNILKEYNIDFVMHMAAHSTIAESAVNPSIFFQTNVVAALNLLDTMLMCDINRIVFSSSAAVYGTPRVIPIDEESPLEPINSYGESKLVFERILKWYRKSYNIKYIVLRYFNAAGATESLGEDHQPETHLIPFVLQAMLDKNKVVSIFGTDYPTNDGTCIRDYVHVTDIARAHVLAMKKIDELDGKSYNLGNEMGYSVYDIVKTTKKITGVDIRIKPCQRRIGDPPILVASSERAKRELGWRPESSNLELIIQSAWDWMKKHPQGY